MLTKPQRFRFLLTFALLTACALPFLAIYGLKQAMVQAQTIPGLLTEQEILNKVFDGTVKGAEFLRTSGGGGGSSSSGVSPFTVQAVGTTEIRLADTNGPGFWSFSVADFIWSGVHNHTYGLGYNSDLSLTGMPQWGESIEPRYVPGAPPNGLFEKHWNYTSIDRSVTYRPMGFSIDLNTNAASQKWYVSDYRVLGRTDAENGGESFRVDTGAKAVHASALVAGVMGTSTNWPLEVRGPTKGATALGLAPTVNPDDTVVYITPTAVTGDLNWINANSSVSGKAQANFWNTGAGGAVVQVLSNAGDAWFTVSSSQGWAFGSHRSAAGSFKLSNSGTLGSNDRMIVTAAGAVTFTDLATTGAATGKTAVCADTAGRLYRSSASGSCTN
jgi:hypothetical protein